MKALSITKLNFPYPCSTNSTRRDEWKHRFNGSLTMPLSYPAKETQEARKVRRRADKQERQVTTTARRQRRMGSLCVIHMGLHPEWRQVDNKIRRLDLRIADFRLLSNDLRIDRSNLSSSDPEINKVKLLESIKTRKDQVLLEREAIQKEMEHLTVFFHKGAEPEYRALRRFFLSYLYHTSRNSMPNLASNEFDDLLLCSLNGVQFNLPDWNSVYFDAFLCKKVAMGKKISISASGLDTSPLAIALGIMRAGSMKHCDNSDCRKEECLILKEDYERLFEAIFHRNIRTLINQKARREMPIAFDQVLKIQRSTSGLKVR